MPSKQGASSQSIPRYPSTAKNRNSNKDKEPLLTLRDIQVIHGCRINDQLGLCFILEIFNNKGIKVEVPKRNVSPQTLASETFLKFYQSQPFNVQSIEQLEHKLIGSLKQNHHRTHNDISHPMDDDELMLPHTKITRKRNKKHRKQRRSHIAFKQSLHCPQQRPLPPEPPAPSEPYEAPEPRTRTQVNISRASPIICTIEENHVPNVDSVVSKIQYVRNKHCQPKKRRKRKKQNKNKKEKEKTAASNLTSLVPRKPPNTFKKTEPIKKPDLSVALRRIKPVKAPTTNRERNEYNRRFHRRDTWNDDSSSSSDADTTCNDNISKRDPPKKRMKCGSKRYAMNIGRIITANTYEMNCAKILQQSDEMLAQYKINIVQDFENDMKKIDQWFQNATSDLIV